MPVEFISAVHTDSGPNGPAAARVPASTPTTSAATPAPWTTAASTTRWSPTTRPRRTPSSWPSSSPRTPSASGRSSPTGPASSSPPTRPAPSPRWTGSATAGCRCTSSPAAMTRSSTGRATTSTRPSGTSVRTSTSRSCARCGRPTGRSRTRASTTGSRASTPTYARYNGLVPISVGGSSQDAYRVGGQQGDIFGLWGEPLKETAEQIAAVNAVADAAGRPHPRIWVSFRPIIAPTDELAWEKAHRTLGVLKEQAAGTELLRHYQTGRAPGQRRLAAAARHRRARRGARPLPVDGPGRPPPTPPAPRPHWSAPPRRSRRRCSTTSTSAATCCRSAATTRSTTRSTTPVTSCRWSGRNSPTAPPPPRPPEPLMELSVFRSHRPRVLRTPAAALPRSR